jgi:hypothetical protein
MNKTAKGVSLKIVNLVKEIPTGFLERVNPGKSLYFKREFLAAFETNHPHITYNYYIIESEHGNALAVVQKFQIELDSGNLESTLPDKMAKTLRCVMSGKTAQIQVCGNVFLSGEYGISVDRPSFKKEAYQITREILNDLDQASLSFFKDFEDENPIHQSGLSKMNYHNFQVEPNMILKIIPQWDSFDSYKNSLKSKYRVKVNRADAKSDLLHVTSLNAAEIIKNSLRLQQLLRQTTDHADFKTVEFNVATYSQLAKDFSDQFTLNAYFLGESLVGFSTSFIDQQSLDAHFVGFDYEFNREYSIYPRMLNDYVRKAIDLKADTLNLGRTSSEIKSTLGAIPHSLSCYVKHKKSLANLIFKPLVKKIKPTDYKLHNPIK